MLTFRPSSVWPSSSPFSHHSTSVFKGRRSCCEDYGQGRFHWMTVKNEDFQRWGNKGRVFQKRERQEWCKVLRHREGRTQEKCFLWGRWQTGILAVSCCHLSYVLADRCHRIGIKSIAGLAPNPSCKALYPLILLLLQVWDTGAGRGMRTSGMAKLWPNGSLGLWALTQRAAHSLGLSMLDISSQT